MLTAYVLIFVLQTGNSGSTYPISVASAEFSSLQACQTAAAELQRQLSDKSIHTRATLCAKKG